MAETVTINSDACICKTGTVTIQSDSHIYETGTSTIQSNAHIFKDNETITIRADACVLLIDFAQTIPKKIQPIMRNTKTSSQAGGQGDGEFRVF